MKKEHQGKVKATSLVLGRGARVLCDPVFREKCLPSRFSGPKRNAEPPCKFGDIPEVDSVVISVSTSGKRFLLCSTGSVLHSATRGTLLR